jgi:hypothetical protein
MITVPIMMGRPLLCVLVVLLLCLALLSGLASGQLVENKIKVQAETCLVEESP